MIENIVDISAKNMFENTHIFSKKFLTNFQDSRLLFQR